MASVLLDSRRVVLPVPPSANTAYPSNQHGGGRHLSKAGREYKESAGWIIKSALAGWEVQADETIALNIGLWFKDKRRCDLDNFVKVPKDILCEMLGVDDSWKVIPHILIEFRGIDKDNPRCEIVVTRYKTA